MHNLVWVEDETGLLKGKLTLPWWQFKACRRLTSPSAQNQKRERPVFRYTGVDESRQVKRWQERCQPVAPWRLFAGLYRNLASRMPFVILTGSSPATLGL